jgi:threonine synthase
VGNTPLYKSIDAAASGLTHEVYLKDDSQNLLFVQGPRLGAGVSLGKGKRHRNDCTASTGNPAHHIAGICASQKQKAMIFVPAAAPMAKLTQIMMYGARIIPLNGTTTRHLT